MHPVIFQKAVIYALYIFYSALFFFIILSENSMSVHAPNKVFLLLIRNLLKYVGLYTSSVV